MCSTLAERLDRISERIAVACERSARSPDDVALLPITKKVSPEAVNQACELGLRVFGENRVQEAMQKSQMCPSHVDWHMVGHLQRNKAKHAVGLFTMIHSVDSPALLTSLERLCEDAGVTIPVCLQVNVSGESAKFGVSEEDLPGLLAEAADMKRVEVVGLMTMPPFTEDPEGARPHFTRLRELRDRMQESEGLVLPELSMGMSNDFEVAIEEGATWIRLGAVLFGDRAQ